MPIILVVHAIPPTTMYVDDLSFLFTSIYHTLFFVVLLANAPETMMKERSHQYTPAQVHGQFERRNSNSFSWLNR